MKGLRSGDIVPVEMYGLMLWLGENVSWCSEQDRQYTPIQETKSCWAGSQTYTVELVGQSFIKLTCAPDWNKSDTEDRNASPIPFATPIQIPERSRPNCSWTSQTPTGHSMRLAGARTPHLWPLVENLSDSLRREPGSGLASQE